MALAPDDFASVDLCVQVNTMRSYDITFYCLENTANVLIINSVLSKINLIRYNLPARSSDLQFLSLT